MKEINVAENNKDLKINESSLGDSSTWISEFRKTVSIP